MSGMENAYAVIVGIANYQKVNRLPAAVLKDAQDIYDLLINLQYCGYSPHNVQLLLDGQATQANLKQALCFLISAEQPRLNGFHLCIQSWGSSRIWASCRGIPSACGYGSDFWGVFGPNCHLWYPIH